MPQLSLIVGVFDAERNLPLLFDSIERAAENADVSWEAVLVDNNSRDRSLAMMREFATRAKVPVTVLSETRQGVSFARNAGLRAATGDILAVVDSDCILAPDWAAALARTFADAPDLAMIGGRVELYNDADLPISIRRSRTPVEVTVAEFNFLDIPGCNLAFRRALLDRIGPYDVRLGPGTRVGMGEDVDLVYRAARAGGRVRYVPEVVIYHNHGRSRPEQFQRVEWTYAIGKGAFFAKHMLRGRHPFFKRCYWELRALMRPAGPPDPSRGPSLPPARVLRAFLRGAYLQVTDEILCLFAPGSRRP
jgi:GT2 family glycosyltransferase